MRHAGLFFCLLILAVARPALAGDEVGSPRLLVHRNYPRYELERPKTPEEAQRASLERANDQLLFGITQHGGRQHGAAQAGESEDVPAFVAAAKDVWSAALTLVGLTLGFVTKYFLLVFWGAIALGAMCRAIGGCLGSDFAAR